MANPKRGEQLLLLSGKDYSLRMTFNAACEAEAYMERNVMSILHHAEKLNVGFAEVRALLWSSIKGQHDIRTIEDVGQLIGDNTEIWPEIAQAVFVALGELFPAKSSSAGNSEGE